MCEIAANFSVLSLGISCFEIKASNNNHDETKEEAQQKMIRLSNQTFNLFTLCKQEFKIEADSMKFLTKHGFDFNSLFSKGISYYKGNDRVMQFQFFPLLISEK